MGRQWGAFSFFLSHYHSYVWGAFFISLSIISNFVARYLVWLRMCFTLRSWVVPCWFIGFLENSFRDQTPLHPTGSQPINNTTPSCNSNTRISPDKTIIFFTKPFESKVFLFFSWDTRSPYVCWVVVIDLNQTEALCNWEWETFGSRSFCKKKKRKTHFTFASPLNIF